MATTAHDGTPLGAPVGSVPAAVARMGSMFRFSWSVTERFDTDLDPSGFDTGHDPDPEGSTPVLWVPDGTIPQGSWRISVNSHDPVHVALGKGKGKGGKTDPIVAGSWTGVSAGVMDFSFALDLRRDGFDGEVGVAEPDAKSTVTYRSSPYGRELRVSARLD